MQESPIDPARQGIVLLDESDSRRLYRFSSENDQLTPVNSIASPAIYYRRPEYDNKHCKPLAPTTRFGLGDNDPSVEPVYPDGDSGGRFGFLRQTNTQIIIGVVLGVGLGVLLSHLEVSKDVSDIVNLPGKIFLRMLKCFVIPMVFCSLSTGVASIVLLGKVSAVGTRTALLFLFFSGVASILSLSVAMSLRGLHPHSEFKSAEKIRAFVHVQCAPALFLQQANDSGLRCTATEMSDKTEFEVIDLSGAIINTAPIAKLSISEQFTRILQSLIPQNIASAFESGVLLSVIMFAIAFGAAAMRTSSQQNSPLLDLLNQMNKIFFFVIGKLIAWSPIAVLSLIAGSLSSQKSMQEAVNHVGVLLLCNFISVVLFEFGFFPLMLYITTRRNPFKYMRQMLPCVYFAFGSASSIATLPVTLRCVESTREVSRSLLRFVVTIGSTVHMNGTAMLFPNAIVFLASTSTSEIDLGWVEVVLIVLVSLLSSIGVAPIPNGGLVMVYSIWSTIFPNHDMPASYSFLVAIYWYLDRVETACNVVGDTYVSRIVAEQVDETFETAHQDAQLGFDEAI